MYGFSFKEYVARAVEVVSDWQSRFSRYTVDPSLHVSADDFERAFTAFVERIYNTYPFFHPLYAGQMLKPPHPAAVVGYFVAMQMNPNNHALDGGPETGAMEKEVVAELAGMVGYDEHLGHLTSSGTIANLEALWIARELAPGKSIAFSSQSHYTHARMCGVLSASTVEVPADNAGRMDVKALRALLLSENIGTVVVTLGTTSLGALDPLDEILEMREEYGFRVHVDAAYGGFFNLLTQDDPETALVPPNVFHAIRNADSFVVDPHKHGLQPYGCGCILFRDPTVGRFYKHDSPYTYFTSDDLHLGEISLECSRAGAAAAALWLTLRLFPLRGDRGLGAVLRQCREAALEWAELLRTSEEFYLVTEPELDIVAFFPKSDTPSASNISSRTRAMFDSAMDAFPEPIFLSLLRLPVSMLQSRYPEIIADEDEVAVLRSVLMKPEHRAYVPVIHQRLCTLYENLPVDIPRDK